MIECFSCHLDGIDEVPATKVVKFLASDQSCPDTKIDLCDDCYKFRMANHKDNMVYVKNV